MGIHFRIDRRLLHGQVIHYWCRYHQAQQVVIVSDEVLNNPIQQSMMRMVAQGAVIIGFSGCTDTWWKEKDSSLTYDGTLFLFQSIQDFKTAMDAADDLVCGQMLNHGVSIGATGKIDEARQVAQGVYLTHKDETILSDVIAMGVAVSVGAVPEEMRSLQSYLGVDVQK